MVMQPLPSRAEIQQVAEDLQQVQMHMRTLRARLALLSDRNQVLIRQRNDFILQARNVLGTKEFARLFGMSESAVAKVLREALRRNGMGADLRPTSDD